MGLGSSPEISGLLSPLSRGSGLGAAESKNFVYGCSGCSYTSRVGPVSHSLPRNITAVRSARKRTTERSWLMKR